MDLKRIFSRIKHTQASEKKRKPEKTSTVGAHELFLEYEGYLSPSKSMPPRRSTPITKPAQPRASGLRPGIKNRLSQDVHRDSKTSCDTPQDTIPSLSSANDENHSNVRRSPSRRRKGFHLLNRSKHEERAITQEGHLKPPYETPPNGECTTRVASRGWLHRCISSASHVPQPSPPPSFTTIPPYPEPPTPQDSEDYTALPVLPGYETEQRTLPEKHEIGAAARAAAAAQKEAFENMRNLRLCEPKLTRDSESGVGIEVRDRGDVRSDLDVPVIRKDPLSVLPEELVGQILSYLDADSLVNAELVSIDWHQSASSHHVWREVFRTEFRNACPTITSPSASCLGLGKALGSQDWKNMWRVRKALEQRWRDGHAAAIYLEGHEDSVYCVQFDEDKILTGSRDRTVRIWDAKTYECIKVLGIPSRRPRATMTPLPGDTDHPGHRPITRIFSPPFTVEAKFSADIPYHTGSILCLQYDADMMITGSSDCTLMIWDVKADYKPVMRLRRHTGGVLDVCFDEKHIVSCSKDSTVCLWDRATGAFLRKMTGHRGPVNAVQLRGDLVVSASGDGIAKLWNIRSGLCIKEFPSKDRGMACVEFSPDSCTILAGGNDQVIYQFDTSTGVLVREMKGHQGLVRSLHLDSASGRVVSGSYDMSVKAYDLRSGETVVNFNKWTASWILSAKSDYRRIVATSQDSRAVIMDFGYQLPGIEMLEA